METRNVLPGDFDAIAEITKYYIAHTTIHFGYEPVTALELRHGWEKGAGRYPYLVAVDEAGAVIAYAKAGVWRERKAYERTAETAIYVRAGMGGKGVGTLLYKRLIEACRGAGLHVLTAGVTIPNEASVRLHLRCGFSPVGEFRQVGCKFGSWHDVAFFQMTLGGASG
jgi:phosphinothricin acetyltransferase